MFKERVLKEGPWHERGDANSMWMKMSTCIRKVASEELGVTKGGKRETKETWWWNENVQNAIKEKKECFRRMHLDRSVDSVERYKVTKKTAKQVVSEARGQMYDGLYQRLGTMEEEKNIYRMAKSRERKTRDIIQVKCIKDATERLLTKDEDIKNRWREYFDKLFNEDSESPSIELDISSDDLNRQFVRRIQESEVEDALKRMTCNSNNLCTEVMKIHEDKLGGNFTSNIGNSTCQSFQEKMYVLELSTSLLYFPL
jgi:hypothetical protein